jgi:hypothetical protein
MFWLGMNDNGTRLVLASMTLGDHSLLATLNAAAGRTHATLYSDNADARTAIRSHTGVCDLATRKPSFAERQSSAAGGSGSREPVILHSIRR